MNLDFNINIGRTQAPATSVPPQDTPKNPAARPSAALTISQAPAAPEDIAAATIPDSALTRDDPLGRLVSSAFTLPPPPMPDFSSIS